MFGKEPPKPVHVKGTSRGEDRVKHHGREPGREDKNRQGYRTARDSTSVSSKHREPIDPRMPNIPPA